MKRTPNCKTCNRLRDWKQSTSYCPQCCYIRYKDRRIKPNKQLGENRKSFSKFKDISKLECLMWVESTIKNKCIVDIGGINMLITVYTNIYKDFTSGGTTGEQVYNMWKRVLVWYYKTISKEIV